MRNILLFTLFAFLSTSLLAQRSFSLEEAIQYALRNNNQIKLANLDAAGAEGQIQEIRSAAIPKLSGGLQYQHFPQIPQSLLPAEFFGGDPGDFIPVAFGLKNSLAASVDLNAILFDPTVFIGIKAAELYRQLIIKQIDQTEFNLKYNVSTAYLSTLIAIENKAMLQNNITSLQKTLDETNAFYKEGFVEKLDVERLELSLENLNVQAENINRFIALSFNLLKFQMGFPLEEAIEVSDNLEVLIGTALVEDVNTASNQFDVKNRPEFGVLKAAEALNEMNIKSIKTEYLPSLYGFGQHSRTLQRDDLFDSNQPDWINVTVVGLQLNVPIFNGFTTKYKLEQARVDLEKTKVQTDDFVLAANLEYTNAKIAYFNSKRLVEANKRTVTLAEKIFETTQIKYREGVGSSLEVTQAERELYQAQGNYITALYDLLVAKTDLQKAIGKL